MQARLRGRRVRVLRAVVYEGFAEDVQQQLASSLPEGTKGFRLARSSGELTITITQAAIEVMDPDGSWHPVEK